MKILSVVGARPNFMKIAPISRKLALYPETFEHILVHTGQHYDASMSKVFLDELELPLPNINLEVGSNSHAQQTALIMQRFEPVLIEHKPDWVLVPGDVNSTLACALVASKLGIKVAHVEAGLRSFDRTMPEEINRIVTDHLSDLLFTTEPSGNQNLLREGIPKEKIHFVGNTMIDTLVRLLPKAEDRWYALRDDLDLEQYILVTLHRPSNVDNLAALIEIMNALYKLSKDIRTIFPIHPRTRMRLSQMNLLESLRANNADIDFLEPQGYLNFLALEAHASVVLTDSGGVQEETTYLGVPCVTVRPNTERPITVTMGTNRLIAGDTESIVRAVKESLGSKRFIRKIPELWDGRAAERIVSIFRDLPTSVHLNHNF